MADIIAEEFAGKPYTRKEAEEASFAFVRLGVEFRDRLLDLFERQAHKALGYVSFLEFSEKRLGLDMTEERLQRLRRWAKVVRVLATKDGEGDEATLRMRRIEDSAKQSIAENVAYELAKLPTDQIAVAYQEAQDLGASAKTMLAQVKHIVARRLKPAVAVSGPPAVTATATVAPTPVPVPPSGAVFKNTTTGPVMIVPVAAPVTSPSPAVAPSTPTPTLAAQKAAGGQGKAPKSTALPPNPHEDWLEALDTAAAWVHNGECDGTKAKKKSVSALLVKVGCWIAEAM